ncbi:hypothetical protein BBJ28_00013065 [Nothophytophthora sp. Chile5]|nr:hypothetical protein BBJ28_00013065 [Nothophytophthora sp. Chile5]
MPRRRSFTAAECLSPRREKEKEKPPKEPSKTGNDSHSTVERFSEQEAIATSFSKLLQLISGDKEDSIEGYGTPMHPNARNRADTVPVDSTRQRNVTRKSADRLWTPNYAKPTQSTAAGTRQAIVGTKQRPHLTSRIKFKANKPLEDLQPNRDHQETNRQEEDAKHLPSNTNEFQEDSFVFFLCGEPSPTSSGYDNRDESSERAQVARVVKTLPSGECLLQLYKREPSRDSPIAMPTRKIRCYSPTPHFVDCCSSQLHSIQSMVCDRQTDKCEWHLLSPESNTSGRTELPSKSTSAADWSPSRRHFYVEVLARITCSPANLAAPMIVTSTKTISPASCRQCPSFSVTFSVPAAPTVFPKVYVNLVSSPPDRFPIRSQLTRRNCVK